MENNLIIEEVIDRAVDGDMIAMGDILEYYKSYMEACYKWLMYGSGRAQNALPMDDVLQESSIAMLGRIRNFGAFYSRNFESDK